MATLTCYDFGTQGFDSDFDIVLSDTLQCTSFSTGSNKFYQMELHHGKTSGHWRVFTANGRTGVYSKPRERVTDSESMARAEYNKILHDKTSRKKEPYTKVGVVATKMGTDSGNQRIISNDFKQDNVVSSTGTAVTAGPPISSSIRALVSRLFTEAGHTCRTQLHGSLKATEENPLGTLSLTQIEEAKSILRRANEVLSKDPSLVGTIDPEVVSVTDAFYSAVPHNIPWRPREEEARKKWIGQFALNNATILDEKYDLLALLGDVKGMLAGFSTSDDHARLTEINSKFEETDSAEFKRISEFMTGTQSRHHNWRLVPQRIWHIDCNGQKGYRDTIDKVGNVSPLFHGSRAANILGICKKGLLIRPPGAYITAAMFGEGLYFADQSTKSSQYATARFGGSSSNFGNTFFMFVADVALGKVRRMKNSDSSLSSAGRGYDSVMGVKDETKGWNGSLLHNEFIVYDARQEVLTHLIEFSQR
jgi:poly [ADP-ribose] polymerase